MLKDYFLYLIVNYIAQILNNIGIEKIDCL